MIDHETSYNPSVFVLMDTNEESSFAETVHLRRLSGHCDRWLTLENSDMAKHRVLLIGATGETGSDILDGLVEDGSFVSTIP